jgi:hypothetical protein
VNHLKKAGDAGGAPPANKLLLTVAVVFLAIPVVGLLWVGSYARVEPTLAGFPFFIWYQFLWVFLCASCTWVAFRIVLIARPRRPLSTPEAKRRETGR